MQETVAVDSSAPAAAECWKLIERVAASPHLSRAHRLRELLFYVARQSLHLGCQHISEHHIGVAVFGRPEDYDTSVDNIVRANATELRKRLKAYFEAEGRNETLICEIPRGGYTPTFRECSISSAGVALLEQPAPALELNAYDDLPLDEPMGASRWPLWLLTASVAVLAATCVALGLHARTLEKALHPWKASPSVSALWAPFLESGQTTDIVAADMSFLLTQHIEGRLFPFDDYLGQAYISNTEAQQLDPKVDSIVRLLATKNMGSFGEFRVAQRILALAPNDKSLHLYSSREYSSPLLAHDNVILLGSANSNPWRNLFDNQLNFSQVPSTENFSPIINRHPRPGEQATYTTDSGFQGYCIVAYLPALDHHRKVLLIGGTSTEATEAGGNFLLSEDRLTGALKLLTGDNLPYFELLLKTSQRRDTPMATTVVAYRTYPQS